VQHPGADANAFDRWLDPHHHICALVCGVVQKRNRKALGLLPEKLCCAGGGGEANVLALEDKFAAALDADNAAFARECSDETRVS
jgi:hypothetical protein